ncbi:anti-sigma factor [Curtobacterium sp. Leaf261]|uniref:anti-sigma factor n=1 Tax=Curtobacterium sp. Leaf261 TaxID=1736311 RepID=UPI0006FA2558|nr:anti-sigma factor [Curtobacterium sp. Leaf261]KQO63501.1 hypothetical protein ASF23_04415 [Curtobacterium sp. Leaf261]
MNGRSDDMELMTGSYALDAVDEAERQAIEAALATSDDMRAEADSLRQTALLLAYAVKTVDPPAELKASLMAKIATTPQRPAQTARHSDTTAESVSEPTIEPNATVSDMATVSDITAPTVGASTHTATGRARARWFQRPAMVLAAAAAVTAVFTGAGLGFNALTNPEQSQTQQASGVDRITAAADFKRSTTDVSTGGTATVVWSDKLGKSGVILKGVGPAPAGKTYELWYIGSKITSAGLMNEVDGGTSSAVLSGKRTDGITVGITIEPKGGSAQPTTDPIAAVTTTA